MTTSWPSATARATARSQIFGGRPLVSAWTGTSSAAPLGAGPPPGAPADLGRTPARCGGAGDGERRAEPLHLLGGRGALHVGGDEERTAPLPLQEARELGAGRRLARALQARHEDD